MKRQPQFRQSQIMWNKMETSRSLKRSAEPNDRSNLIRAGIPSTTTDLLTLHTDCSDHQRVQLYSWDELRVDWTITIGWIWQEKNTVSIQGRILEWCVSLDWLLRVSVMLWPLQHWTSCSLPASQSYKSLLLQLPTEESFFSGVHRWGELEESTRGLDFRCQFHPG